MAPMRHRHGWARRLPGRSLGSAIGLAALVFGVVPAVTVASTATGATAAGTLSALTVVGGQGVGAGANQLAGPTQVAIDGYGDVFVADGADRVVEYPLSSSTAAYATTGTIVEGLGSQVDVTGIALDSGGDLFVTDGSNNRVLEFPVAPNGTYPTRGITLGGTGGEGTGATQLNAPTYLATDASGDLFVADTGNNRVQEYTRSSSGSYSPSGITVAGVGGPGSGTGQLSAPGALAFDPHGDLFVADNGNHRVQEFAFSAGIFASAAVTAYSQSGIPLTFGQLAFNTSGDLFLTWTYPPDEPIVELAPAAGGAYSAVSISAPLDNESVGVAVDGHGNLFISEGSYSILRGVPANLVQELSPTSTTGTYAAAANLSAVAGTGVSPLSAPQGVAIDAEGNLYVADSTLNAVLEFPLNAATGAYSSTGTVVAGAGGAGSGASQLSGPDAVGLDGHGDLFVSDAGNDRVVEYTLTGPGAYSATGTTVAGVGGDGSGANQLNYPNALALDSKGDLFISDEDNSRVLEYTLNTVSGAYSATGTTRASVGGPVALDSHGDLFVGDPSHNRVLEYTLNTPNGTYSTSGIVVAKLGASGSGAIAAGPGTILVDSAGNIFAGGGFYTDDVVEFPISSSGKYPSSPTVLLNGPGAGPSQVGFVWGLAVDSHGDLFIADTQNQRIQELVGIAATSTSPPPPSAPVVTGVTPATGPAAGGTPVTVSGSNLSGASVSFGSAAATGVSCSASSCAATSPAGTGTVNVTVTNSGGTSATSSADQFTYQAAAPPPPPSGNLIPDPGFESSGVPVDNWGSSLARSQPVVHSGSWSLAQTASSSSGGWDLDSNPSWYAPISSATTYTASIWVLSPATVKVDLNVDLLNSSGGYLNSANGPTVTLVANTWAQLTITGLHATSSEFYAGMEPNFSGATKGTVIYWDDMSLTSP
jgi:sugar lactone lactonase YvrE